MQLTLWTYEGPPHVGAMRIATLLQLGQDQVPELLIYQIPQLRPGRL